CPPGPSRSQSQVSKIRGQLPPVRAPVGGPLRRRRRARPARQVKPTAYLPDPDPGQGRAAGVGRTAPVTLRPRRAVAPPRDTGRDLRADPAPTWHAEAGRLRPADRYPDPRHPPHSPALRTRPAWRAGPRRRQED